MRFMPRHGRTDPSERSLPGAPQARIVRNEPVLVEDEGRRIADAWRFVSIAAVRKAAIALRQHRQRRRVYVEP